MLFCLSFSLFVVPVFKLCLNAVSTLQKALGWHPLTIRHVIITHCYQQLGTRQLASNAERLGNNQSFSFRNSDRRCIFHLTNAPVLKRDNCKDDLRRTVNGYGYRCRSHMLFVLIKQLAAVCFSLICVSAKSDVWEKKKEWRGPFSICHHKSIFSPDPLATKIWF